MLRSMCRGGHAGAAGDADAGAVAAGDERVGAVVDVEQCALGAFEQEPLAAFGGGEQQLGRVANVRPQSLGVAGVFVDDRGRIERLEFAGRVEDFEHAILGGDDVLDLRAERRAIEVAQADGVRAADLVAIAGADAAAGGADVLAVGRALVERAVLGEVPGEDHVRPVADSQIVGVAGTAFGELIELLDHAGRIHDDARGDDARDARREDAAGQQRELVDLSPTTTVWPAFAPP